MSSNTNKQAANPKSPAAGTRFAHFAGVIRVASTAAAPPPRRAEIVASPAMRQAALRRAMVNGQAPAASAERHVSGADAVALAKRLGVIR